MSHSREVGSENRERADMRRMREKSELTGPERGDQDDHHSLPSDFVENTGQEQYRRKGVIDLV